MEWISVKDHLPEEGKVVLRYGNNIEKYEVDYIVTFDEREPSYIWAGVLVDDYLKVTHWMPLPEPPKEPY